MTTSYLLALIALCSISATANNQSGNITGSLSCVIGTEYIIDDKDPAVVALGWHDSTAYPNFQYAGGFKATRENANLVADISLNGVAPGTYQVSVYFPGSLSRSSRAPHIVVHDQGTRRVLVNQKVQPASLSSLVIGNFSFGAFPNQRIRVESSLHQNNVLDVIRLLCVGPPSNEPTVRPTTTAVVRPTTTTTARNLNVTQGPTEPDFVGNAVPATAFTNPQFNNGQDCVVGWRYTIDNTDDEVQFSPSFALKTAANVAFKNTFLSSEDLPNLSALYRTNNMPRGNYSVHVYFPASTSRTRAAPHVIIHTDGRTRVLVDQKVQPLSLLSLNLGTYSFGGGPGQGVRVDSVSGDKVVADAISFVCLNRI